MDEKVNGFETKIEELKSQNSTLSQKTSEYETKLAEWQTKLKDQQTTIDTLAAAIGEGAGSKTPTPSSGHKSVRYDPIQDKLIYDD